MMQILLKSLAIVLLVLSFSGCLVTRNEVKDTETRKSGQDQVTQMQKANADQSIRYSEVEEDLRTMNGRIDLLENKMSQLQTQNREKDSDSAKSQEADRKMTALQEEIQRLNGLVEALTQDLASLKAASEATKITEPSGKKGPLDIADDYFDKKEWKKAIFAYKKFRDENPKSKRVPKAILRMGQSFWELGMKDDAKTFYEDVISKFPTSDEAKTAKTLLKKK